MFYLPSTKTVDSNEAILAPGAVLHAESQAMVRVPGATAAGVQPSTGAAGEIFVGFAFAGVSAAPFPEAYTNKVETFVVPASGIVPLQFAPVAGQVSILDKTAGAAAAVHLAGNQLSQLTPGNTVVVTYKYALTVVQARALFGDVQPGGYAGAQVGQIGLKKRGVAFVSEFDASVDWSAATEVRLAPNGQLTDQNGTGSVIQAVVVALPSQDIPYLGLEFAAL